MIWRVFNKKKKIKHEQQDKKILMSQQFLIEAAISTAETAKEVTDYIKKQLNDSQAELTSTVKIIQDGLIVTNEKNEIVGFNPAAEKIFDCKFEDIINTNFLKLFVGVNNKPIDEGTFWSILTKEKVWNTDFDNEPMKFVLGKRFRGETFFIDISVSELSLQDEKKFLFLVRDLNDEMRNRQSEFDHKSLFENNKDCIFILQNHKIIKANKTAIEFLQIEKENLENTLFEHLIEFSEREKIFDIQEKHLNGEIQYPNYTFTLLKNNIEVLATELSIKWNNQNCILCTFRPKEDMKKLNEFLISNEKKFHNISENAPDLICVFDKNLQIKYINPSFKEFYNVTDDVKMLSDYLPFARRNNFITFLTEINDTKRQQFNCRGGDRENIQDWVFYPIIQNNEIIEYHGIGRDITYMIDQMGN